MSLARGEKHQRVRKRDCELDKKEPELVVSMQPRFKDLYARALVAGPPYVIGTRSLIADGLDHWRVRGKPQRVGLTRAPWPPGCLARPLLSK